MAGFLLYLNTLQNDFAWDDSIVILENERVQKGISGIHLHFTKYASDQLQDRYGYRPVTLIIFSIEYQYFGLNPIFYHLINAGLFGICCVMIYIFLKKLFPDKGIWFAFLIGLIFSCHPVHTEAVANIKSLDEILAFLFSLVSLNFFLNWLLTNSFAKKLTGLLLSILFFVLAFLSKENSVSIAGIWILLVILLPGISLKRRFISLSPIIIVLLVAGITFWLSSQSKAGIETTEGVGIVTEGRILGNSIFYTESKIEVAAFSFRLLIEYLRLFFFPWPLRYYYGLNQIPIVGWGNPIVIISILLHFGLLLISWLYRKKEPSITFGIVFYLITLFLYLHLVKPLDDTLAERFLFTPSLGLCIAFIAITGRLFKIDFESSWNFRLCFLKNNIWFCGIFGFLFLSMVILTLRRNSVWKNNQTLFTHDMAYLENCARAHYNYAGILAVEYEKNHNKKLLPELIKHYKRTIEISEEAYYARLELGLILMESGNLDEGVKTLEIFQKKFPEEARPYFWLGYGKYHQGKFQEALPFLEKSIALAPKRLDTYYYLAWTFYKIGNRKQAIQLMEERIQINPETLTYYDALSDFYFSENQVEKGFLELEKVIKINPEFVDVWKKMILRYHEGGNTEMAKNTYLRAISKGISLPDYEILISNLSSRN